MVKMIVAQLDRDGLSQTAISEELHRRGMGVSQRTVSTYLRQVREEYQQRQDTAHAEKVNRKHDELRDVRRRAIEGWNWSTGEAVSSLAEQVLRKVESMNRLNLPLPDNLQLSIRFAPMNEFLTTVLSALKLEANIDGLTQRDALNLLQQQFMQLDWGTLTTPPEDNGRNAIDRRLAEVAATPAARPRIGLHEMPNNGNQPPPRGA
jgi:hypothetical protein